MTDAPTSPPAPSSKEAMGLAASLSLVTEIGFLIVVPAFTLGFGGALIDKKLHSSPIFVIIGLLTALCASGLAVYRKVSSVIQ